MAAPKRRKVQSESAGRSRAGQNFFNPHVKSNAWLRSYQPRHPVCTVEPFGVSQPGCCRHGIG